MERQENDENNADIIVKMELEYDVEERMQSYSCNEDNETARLESDISFQDEQRNSSYIETTILEFEEEAVAFIKPERNDPVESESEEEDVVEIKEVKLLLTKFDKFTCVVCDRNLDSSVPMGACRHDGEFVLFCKDCVKPNGRKYMCVKCSYGSSSRFYLIRHVNRVHRKLKSYKFKECDCAFARRDHLKKHVQSTHRKKIHSCQQCKKVFSEHITLIQHVNFVHRKLNIFTCDLCNKEFPTRAHFKVHIDRVHRKIKELECKECKSAFFDKKDLTQHVNSVHRKFKPFACDKCNFSYSRQSDLRKHIDSVHHKIKYSCAECNKAFTLKGSLVDHIHIVHRKIKRFVCKICKHAYGRKLERNRHVTKCKFKNIKQSKSNSRR